MGVNHYLLPIDENDLQRLLADPKQCPDYVEARESEVQTLYTMGVAITALIAEDENDPLSFLQVGTPDGKGGCIGQYNETDGVVTCEVDMGYGPAWWCHHSYLATIAEKIKRISVLEFSTMYDAPLLEEHHVYPTGWCDEDRTEFIVECFDTLRSSVINASSHRFHLLSWCA